MPDYSAAQVLLQHIVEAIVGYIPQPISSFHQDSNYIDPPRISTELLPCMQICQAWRCATAPMFYRSAVVMHQSHGDRGHRVRDGLHLWQAVSNQKQRYVKEVFLYIDVGEFELPWGNEIVDVPTTLRNYGQLPNVRSVILEFCVRGYPLSVYGHGMDRARFSGQVTRYTSSLVESVLATMPRITQAAIYTLRMEYMQRVIAEIGSAFVQFAGMLMHQATTSLLLENIPLPVLQGACSNLTLLRELVIWDTECQPEAVSLAKHHAETLEKLVIGYMRPQQMLDLVWNGGVDAGQTCVYPRLKHLHLRCCEDQLEYAHPKSLTNPFPVLKVFINEDTLPYAASVILDGNRSRLCHLRLDLCWSEYQWLIDKGILAKSAFTNLRFVSLLCQTYNEYEWGYDLACVALGLCRTIRSVHLDHVYGDDISDTLSLLNSLNDLRILDMGSANITLDQAVSILCACPSVQTAKVALKPIRRYANGDKISAETIVRYKEKYSGHTSPVCYLSVISASSSKAVYPGYIALLVYLLGNVVRVTTSQFYGELTQEQFADKVGKALQIPVYDDRPQVRNIEYVLGYLR